MVFFQHAEHLFFRLLDEGFAGLCAGLRRQFLELALDVTAPQVARHDDDGVLEVHHASLIVGQTAVVEHLQEDVEYVRMRLFYFIEQNYRVRFAAYGSVSCPPSSYPTYPGGAPINRLTLNFS